MNSLDVTRNVYWTMVDPPHGYILVKTEVLTDAIDGPDATDIAIREELGLDPDWTLDGKIIFRAVINRRGETKYVSMWIDSKAVLCKKDFWQNFWQQVMYGDPRLHADPGRRRHRHRTPAGLSARRSGAKKRKTTLDDV